jgi:hypothetical protein
MRPLELRLMQSWQHAIEFNYNKIKKFFLDHSFRKLSAASWSPLASSFRAASRIAFTFSGECFMNRPPTSANMSGSPSSCSPEGLREPIDQEHCRDPLSLPSSSRHLAVKYDICWAQFFCGRAIGINRRILFILDLNRRDLRTPTDIWLLA